MATEIGKNMIIDTDSRRDYAIGLTLPLQFNNNTFAQSFKTIDQIRSNIKNLLLTRKGERILQPEFGSGLHELLFNPLDSDFELQVETAINNAIEMWLPSITIEDIQIDMSDNLKDRNTVTVSLKFRVGDNIDLQSLTFTLQE